MPFKMKGTAMYDKVQNDRGISSMTLKSPMEKSPMDKSPMDKSPMDRYRYADGKSAMPKSPMDKSPMDHAHGAMNMSHMKLTQDAAMKMTSALKKSPMDSQGLKNLAKANPDKLKYIGD